MTGRIKIIRKTREEYLSKYVMILIQFFMNVPFVDGMNTQWRIMHMKN